MRTAFPERLIIYHAGTGKTTFLACLKVTTLFLFGFFDMIMTPAYFAAGEPLVKTAGGMPTSHPPHLLQSRIANPTLLKSPSAASSPPSTSPGAPPPS